MKRLLPRKLHGNCEKKSDYASKSPLTGYGHWILLSLFVLLVAVGPAAAAAPVASFTTVTPTGDYPAFLVKFTDTSVNDTPLLGRIWYFRNVTPGNNTLVAFSQEQNPYIIFTGNGDYEVTLYLEDENHDWDQTDAVTYSLSDCNGGDSCHVRIYTTYDGGLRNTTAGTWSAMRDASASSGTWTNNNYTPTQVTASGSDGIYADMYKTLTTFDTSVIPSASTITGADLTYFGSEFKSAVLGAPNLSLIDAAPSNPALYTTGDWSKTAYQRQAADITYEDWVVKGPNTFTDVNISYITKGGKTVLGTALNWTVDNQEPEWSSGNGATIHACSMAAIGDNVCYANRSYLEVSYDKTNEPSPPEARYSVIAPAGLFPDFKMTLTDTSTNVSTSWSWTANNVTGNNTPFEFATTQEATILLGVGNWSIQHTAVNADGENTTAPAFYNISECSGVTCDHRFYPSNYGGIQRTGEETWNVKRDAAAGNAIWAPETTWYLPVPMPSTDTEGVYGHWNKPLFTFPTSLLTDSVWVTGATVKMWGADKANSFTIPDAALVDADPSDPADYAVGDWSRTTYTRLSEDVPYADFNTTPGPVNFVLNDNSYIEKTGSTSFFFTNNYIADDVEPTPWVNDAFAYLYYCDANAAAPGVCKGLDNTLEVTYSLVPAPVAAFSGTPVSGAAPLTVVFTDLSTNNPTEWNWSFGDGSLVNVTDQNPVHTFASPGNYTVSLNATNAVGSNTATSVEYITVIPAPAVTEVSPTSGPAAGGTLVTLIGTGFTGATAVRFGTTAGTGMTVNDDTNITVTSPAHAAGIVNITVTTPGGTSATSTDTEFTYTARPTVTAVSPASGPLTGATAVTLTGTGFTGATSVMFGATAGTGVTVNSDTNITVTSPAHTAGTVYVTVTAPGGTSATVQASRFSYVIRPGVTGATPSSGPVAGGNLVVLTGTGFTGATSVMFGATAGTGVTVNSATNITVTAPAHTSGTVYVTVTTPGGTSATMSGNRYTYVLAPGVTNVSPASGLTTGGTRVTLTGTGFTGATAVRFGTTAGTSMTVNSSTRITVTAPAHAAGAVYVTVTTPGGTSASTSGSRFTYTALPTVTAVSPANGPTTAGIRVTLTGTGFTGATAVRFGTTAGTSMTVNSSTRITVTAPAHAAGAVYVTVTTPGGTSATGTANRYTYMARPNVTAISPVSGPTTAGTRVTLTGNGFTGATAVMFGTTAGTSMTVNSSTRITVTAPAHAAGAVYVTVITPGGTSATNASANRFTYMARPNVTAISPVSGPTTAGTRVTLTGNGFTGATAVMFGTTAGTSMTVNSSTRITVTAPAHAAGAVYVTVTTPGGTSATGTANRYTYMARPNVTAISPSSGPAAGGTRVTLTGNGFTGATAVRFGTTAATSMTVNSSTRITVTAPAHAAGIVDITAITPGGTSPAVAADRYTYTV
jgi:PKD repeat protein